MYCQFALNILQLLSCDGGGFPAEEAWLCIAGSAGLVSCTWCLSSSIVIPLLSDRLISPVTTQRANKNPWILTCTYMIINANKIFMKTHMNISSCVHVLTCSVYRQSHMLQIYMHAYCIHTKAHILTYSTVCIHTHVCNIDKMAYIHTHKYSVLFSLFSSCTQDDCWMLFCFDYTIDF